MSAPRQLPPPSNPALLPVLGAATYLAVVVGYWGILSLALNRDVIDYPDAGPLLGPAMALAACILTWLASWRSRSWVGAIIALVGSYLGMLVVGALGYMLTRGELERLLATSVHFAISPFVLGAAVLAALVVVGVHALRSAR